MGTTSEAFSHLSGSNAAHRAQLPYDFAADEAIFETLRRAFARRLPLVSDSQIPDAPIFVVGLPRTGTALVERILSSHPGVTSVGEMQAMPLAVKQTAGTKSRTLLDPQTIDAMAGRSAKALGELYLARACDRERGQGSRFTDSLPLNFLYVGWIVEALPNANIVCLRRGTMDSVWSNFKHGSHSNSPDYLWSSDLMDTARYALMYQRIMAFWRQRFPGRIHEVIHDLLVVDQEAQTRRMFAHCGLPWNAACMEVAAQTVLHAPEPQDARAAGGWRDYQEHLGEVMDFFTDNGIPLD